MIIHPAIWDVNILNRILTDCKAFARPDPELPGIGVLYPVELNAVIHQVIDLMVDASHAKARLGLDRNQPGIGTGSTREPLLGMERN